MDQKNGKFNVGGVLLPRPFKIRRLGHFGFNLSQLTEGVRFYTDLLGFRITDEMDLSKIQGVPPALARLPDPRVVFTSHGSDHHALLLAPKALGSMMGDDAESSDITVNQITWQVGTLEEVVNAYQFLKERGIKIRRVGRDMPGSNWHVYFCDPDGHTIELYYGMEQVGWTHHSKPKDMYYRRFDKAPSIPQMSETMEIEEALQKGYCDHLRVPSQRRFAEYIQCGRGTLTTSV
jgi:catechol 2,3-dioxygenase-like lactoylglutathione lyase family enzyme